MLTKSLLLLLAVLGSLLIHAQEPLNKDSLLRLLPAAKEDTNKVQLLIQIGQQVENNEPKAAKWYYKTAGELSKKINYPIGIIKYITNYTYVLNVEGLYDSSLILNKQSVTIAKQINDSPYIAKTLFNTGTSYRLKEEYENAVQYYQEGKVYFDKIGTPATQAQGNDILQLLYYELHQYDKGITYGEAAVAGLRTLNDPAWLVTALNNLGLNYSSARQLDKALKCFEEALALAKKTDNKYAEESQYLNIGDTYMQQGNYGAIKAYFSKGLTLAIELEANESQMLSYKGLSYYYHYTKDYHRAKQYADSALAISYRYNYRVERAKLLTHLSNLAYSMQDKLLAEKYATQSTVLNDSLLNETIAKNAQELETKYETRSKENRIKELNAEKQVQQLTIQRQHILNYILIASAIVLLLLSLLAYRNHQQKQKLQQQRINELETERQLLATEAVLKGEAQERTRLARDLHDGLGGMLSGIKYSLHTMKGNLIMTPENAQAFERSLDMLDSSIKEMRRVAHNMMPEALVKFGLDTALKDFCNEVNQTGSLHVHYQSLGLEGAAIDQSIAITVYRIVQELINNTLKHAAAKNAIVQVSQTDGLLSVTVEDDGTGFDTAILEAPQGIGWSNIKHRIEFLKGKLDVNSQPGKGTSVLIEIGV